MPGPETIRPADLIGLTERQLADYAARLGRWKALQGPWEPHSARLTCYLAEMDIDRERARRGKQLTLWTTTR